MRFVNWRRLLGVVLIAAVFAAVLPYVGFVAPEASWLQIRTTKEGTVHEVRIKGVLCERVDVYCEKADLSAEEREEVRVRCSNLAPEDTVRGLDKDTWIVVQRAGWPFRSVYMTLIRNFAGEELASTLTSRKIWGLRFPTGIQEVAFVANVVVFVLGAGIVYCGVVSIVARRRIKRGLCYRCGFAKGAGACPKCAFATMRRSRRARLVTAFTGVAISAAILGLAIWSCWFYFSCASPQRVVTAEVSSGAVKVSYFEYYARTGSLGVHVSQDAQKPVWWFKGERVSGKGTNNSSCYLIVPLWAPFLLAASYSGLLLWRVRVIAGRADVLCENCDYDLGGLGRDKKECPECGAPLEKRGVAEKVPDSGSEPCGGKTQSGTGSAIALKK